MADVRTTVERTPYMVRGETKPEVRKHINLLRPQGYDAMTTWNIQWNYTYRETRSGCEIASVTTSLAVAYVMPRLQTTNSALNMSFRDYLAKLGTHEKGHALIALSIARRIDAAIAPMRAPTCEGLGNAANALGDRIIQEGIELNNAYDARTDHGRTQGARW
jgi:predicted secreted Zn-dependent protease